eukprot:1102306-Lingulodinium_polyedra.AAC.1
MGGSAARQLLCHQVGGVGHGLPVRGGGVRHREPSTPAGPPVHLHSGRVCHALLVGGRPGDRLRP